MIPAIFISEKQYKNAYVALTENGDHYLIISEKETRWLCNDSGESFRYTQNEGIEELTSIDLPDDTGAKTEMECYVLPTEKLLNHLDLEALQNGQVSWI